MTHIRKKLISITALILVLITLTSCGGGGLVIPGLSTDDSLSVVGTEGVPGSDAPQTQPPSSIIPEGLLVAGPDITSTCAVVYPSGATTLKSAAEEFVAYFTEFVAANTFTARANTEDAIEEYKIVIAIDGSVSGYSVKLEGKTINVKGKNTANTLEGLSYLKLTALQGRYFAIPEDLDFSSGDGPVVLTQYPEKYYYYEDIYTPNLEYSFDAAKVDIASSRLVVAGVDVTKKAKWDGGKVTLNDVTVTAGDHTVLLALAGKDGSVEVLETSFSCGDASEMNLYAGELHGHTLDSDGQGTITEAYTYARDVAGLDFFSITDHSNYFKGDTY